MAAVDSLIPNPSWQEDILGEVVQLHRVLVSTTDPLLDGQVVVHLEGIKVSVPHIAGGMVGPSGLSSWILGQLERAVDQLHGFYTLFAKTLSIQGCE